MGNTGFGVRGDSTDLIGVVGLSTNFVGVAGSGPVYGVLGTSATGTGVYGSASTGGDGVFGTSVNGYGVHATSSNYRAGYFNPGNTAFFSLYVDGPGVVENTICEIHGSMEVVGNLVVDGSKGGYVVDEMQNADSVNLELGDVVVIAEDSSAPVLGKIPVPRIKLAANANDTAVVGVVD